MAAVTGCSLTRENPKLDKRTLTKQTESSAADWFQCDYDAMVSVFGKMSEKELEKNLAQNDYVSIAEMYGKMSDEELLSALSAYGYDQAGVESLKKTMIVPAVAISKLIEQHGDDIAAIKAGIDEGREYAKMQKKYGAMKKIENTDYSLASNSASVAVTVSTEKAGKLVVRANRQTGRSSRISLSDRSWVGRH